MSFSEPPDQETTHKNKPVERAEGGKTVGSVNIFLKLNPNQTNKEPSCSNSQPKVWVKEVVW